MANIKRLKKVVKELEGASKMHLKQSKDIKSHVKAMQSAAPFKMKTPLYKKGPCWKGYEMIGMKKKGGRNVPNCVPKKK